MAQVAIPLMIAGTVMSAAGQLRAGNAAAEAGMAQEQASRYAADQADAQAGQEIAMSQREAQDARRQERFAQSRLQALAAASGGGATDPTVLNLSSGIAEEGTYNALTALYNGEERARALRTTAIANRFEGAQYRRAGEVKRKSSQFAAVGTLLQGGAAIGQTPQFSSLLEKYG